MSSNIWLSNKCQCLIQIEARVKDKTPYVVVALQEAARMNTLLTEMRQSMEELLLGLGGSLNMSDKMEKLATGKLLLVCASIDRVHAVLPSFWIVADYSALSFCVLCRYCNQYGASFVDGSGVYAVPRGVLIDILVHGE